MTFSIIIYNHQLIITEWLGNNVIATFALGLGLLIFIFINFTNVNIQPVQAYTFETKVADESKVENKLFPSVHKPPNVVVLTEQLTQGKNVLRINITSEVGIANCKISFIKQGTIKTIDCVNDHNSVYKALIDAEPPSSTVQVYVQDILGDTTDSIKKLNVVPQPSFLDQILKIFSG